MLQEVFIGQFTGTKARVNPSISSILAAMPAQPRHAVQSQTILREIARDYAADVHLATGGRERFTYAQGYCRGTLATRRALLRLFLRDLPRAEQLAIGAATRRTLAGLHQSSNPVIQ